MQAQLQTLERSGDQAEAELYRARRRLADADSADADSANVGNEADRPVLQEWVEARQTELSAARTSVDSLTTAIANLAQLRRLWEMRARFMNEPDSGDLAEMLAQVITDANTARAAKDEIEARLSALRSIQLAQTRRLRDPALSDALREPLAVRTAALEQAEGYGRQLLETQDSLIALLEGMRYQLEQRVQQENVSLQLLQAQEALTQWWGAELIEIDDQAIRVRDLVIALAMFFVVLGIVSLIRMGARRALRRRRAKSASTEYGDLRLALSAVAGNTSQVFVLIAAFYVAMIVSGLASPTVEDWAWTALVIAFYAQLGIWASAAMVDYFNRKRTRQEMRDPSTVTGYGVMMVFFRVGIWITVIVSLLAYFKYPVAGLVGALGVSSLAIAFAVNTILADVFSSMAIVLDKPFRVGDFISSGETLGVIEYIGVKTTRIRSLSGEQVILSNSDLINSRIHNYKHMKERRVVFRIGVVYQTPRPLLERIPSMLRSAIEETPDTRFDRAHFVEYGDYALVFEVVYYVLSPDYTVYMDAQQRINLAIHRRFEEAGVAFAYPTQQLILQRGAALPAAAAQAREAT
jgi:small-conductance mechanosensitive channel